MMRAVPRTAVVSARTRRETSHDVDVSRSAGAVVVAEIAAADEHSAIRLRFRSNRDSFTFGGFGFGSNAFG